LGIEFNALFSALFVSPALIFALLFAKDKLNYKKFQRKSFTKV
ncbi:MFS transporter, partial [Campylobacter jejuni]|nr:MFS transporter [Campylobacter jejuni]